MLSPWLYPDVIYQRSWCFLQQQKFVKTLFSFVENVRYFWDIFIDYLLIDLIFSCFIIAKINPLSCLVQKLRNLKSLTKAMIIWENLNRFLWNKYENMWIRDNLVGRMWGMRQMLPLLRWVKESRNTYKMTN